MVSVFGVFVSVQLVALTGSALRTMEDCSKEPVIRVVLSDGHRKVPGGLEPIEALLVEEFRRIGVGVVWTPGDHPSPPEDLVRIAILPHDGADWGSARKALGATVRDGGGSSVFIFYPAVERTLGRRTETSRISGPDVNPQEWQLGLARVITHEILHALLPAKLHDTTGVFAEDVRVQNLVAREPFWRPGRGRRYSSDSPQSVPFRKGVTEAPSPRGNILAY